ncbi:Uncharacterised protein [Mycobacterium tuberculosis]|nr:Uncharacterised protein [Mycobacterium tuberculosis]CKT97845.1 Uncharacterised protein [Mycobacterium tuberculosis]CMT97337.1 Uncharacterised protein [Mycobacterium tuberculosis]CNI44093.1 Uncharacterised protein [Mycobacterium tuberculosis]CNM66302.1 Uncharacterised protein [Mycobacterium tuberculosis]
MSSADCNPTFVFSSSLARAFHPWAAASIGPEPGPRYIRVELISGGNAQKLGIIRYSLVLAGSHSCVTGDTLETFVVGDLDFLIRKRAIRQGPDQFSMKGRAPSGLHLVLLPVATKEQR